ncbi:dienelactone hydrolase family protein [Leifsonia sp. TF02-11]|uniref:dienelactone hydrolase family protein n=1 Tax=Leifsonia sp. TF02-11 TaxID=2815212 RepID=UPI0027DDD71B|nr:dienelactone hydrolase family protein [Leifsonia sp. TF02-11]
MKDVGPDPHRPGTPTHSAFELQQARPRASPVARAARHAGALPVTTENPSPALSTAHQALLEQVPIGEHSVIETEVVEYEHEGVPLEGYLARDVQADERRPAVLILHDWNGVGDNVRMRAQMLARCGYVAFAADLYGADVRPSGDEAPKVAGRYYGDLALLRSRVAAGFSWLQQHPAVDPARLAVIGYCFGGTAALEFARTGAPARGVVSFHGGLIAHDPSDAAAIAASLLVLTGGSDPAVPDDAVAAFENELRAAPHVDWQLTTYSGAPHAFTIPGTDRYRPLADARSWRALVCFLDEIFA